MANQTVLISLMKPTATQHLTRQTKRLQLTLTVQTVRIGCLSAPTTNAFPTGGNVIRSMTVEMAAMNEDVERTKTQQLLRSQRRRRSPRNVDNMNSDVTQACASQGVTFAMVSQIVEEVRNKFSLVCTRRVSNLFVNRRG